MLRRHRADNCYGEVEARHRVAKKTRGEYDLAYSVENGGYKYLSHTGCGDKALHNTGVAKPRTLVRSYDFSSTWSSETDECRTTVCKFEGRIRESSWPPTDGTIRHLQGPETFWMGNPIGPKRRQVGCGSPKPCLLHNNRPSTTLLPH